MSLTAERKVSVTIDVTCDNVMDTRHCVLLLFWSPGPVVAVAMHIHDFGELLKGGVCVTGSRVPISTVFIKDSCAFKHTLK